MAKPRKLRYHHCRICDTVYNRARGRCPWCAGIPLVVGHHVTRYINVAGRELVRGDRDKPVASIVRSYVQSLIRYAERH